MRSNLGKGNWHMPVIIIWGVAACFYVVEWMQRVMPTLLVDPIVHSMHVSMVMIGTIFSVYYYVYAFAQIPAGLFIDYFGPRRMLTMAAILVALGTACFAMAVSVPLLFFGRILIGLGSAFGFSGCIKIARTGFSKRAFPLMVSLTNSVGMLGALFGMAPLTWAVMHVGWRDSLWGGVVLTCLVALLLWALIRDHSGRHHFVSLLQGSNPFRALGITFMVVVKVRRLWLIGLYAGLMQVPIIAYAELWAVPFLHHVDALSLHLAAEVNSWVFVGIFLGGPIFGLIFAFNNWIRPSLLMANLAILLILYLLFFTKTDSFMYLCALNFLLGFFTVSMLISYTWAARLFKDVHVATAVAFTNMIGVIIGGFFQQLIGFFFPKGSNIVSYHHAFTFLVIASLLSLCCMFIISHLFKYKPLNPV